MGPGATAASLGQLQSALVPAHSGVPGASGPLGRFALVYMDAWYTDTR